MSNTSNVAAGPSFGQILEGVTYIDRPGAYALIQNAMSELAVVRTPHGLFLPGGGAEPGESPESALVRELREEIGYEVIGFEKFAQAVQYHWSEFYRQYFRKIGSFFRVQARPLTGAVPAGDHQLLWLPSDRAALSLSQEFQRWAVGVVGKRS